MRSEHPATVPSYAHGPMQQSPPRRAVDPRHCRPKRARPPAPIPMFPATIAIESQAKALSGKVDAFTTSKDEVIQYGRATPAFEAVTR
jgi:hypothetical protein